MTKPEFVILAGPNGVGKTTFAQLNLQSFIDNEAFLNADDMARDVNPSDMEAVAIDAGRRMLSRRKEFIERHRPFCLETTLATRTTSPTEIVRRNEAGVRVGNRTAFSLLNEAIAVAGGHPLA